MSDEQKPAGSDTAAGGEGDAGGQRSRRRRRPRRRTVTGGQSPVAAQESAGGSSQQPARQPQSARDPQPAAKEPAEGKRRRSSRGRRRSQRPDQPDAALGGVALPAASSPASARPQALTEGDADNEGRPKRSRRRKKRPTAALPQQAEPPQTATAASPAKRRRSAGRPAAPRVAEMRPSLQPLNTALAFPDEDGWGADDEAALLRAEETEDGAGEKSRFGPSMLEEPEVQLDPDGADEFLELEEEAPATRGSLANLVGVRLREGAKVFPFSAGTLQLAPGEQIVVETELGLAIGQVAHPPQQDLASEPTQPVLRRVDQNDLRQQARNLLREREAFEYCQQRIAHRRLPMKLIRAEYVHGGNKAVFFFAAENRIDFRDLVKDLAQRLHTRIVMRQVGVRDESRMIGGIGSCGCELCCSTWLPRFEPVSIRMAKDQGLVLNPQKVSGQCGRLKCCLTYEQHQYQEVRKLLPKPGRKVTTPDGEGRVQELDVLRLLVRVSLQDGSMQTYPANQVKPIAAPSNALRQAKPAADE